MSGYFSIETSTMMKTTSNSNLQTYLTILNSLDRKYYYYTLFWNNRNTQKLNIESHSQMLYFIVIFWQYMGHARLRRHRWSSVAMISDKETFLSVVKQYEKPKININSLFRVLKVIVIILTINWTRILVMWDHDFWKCCNGSHEKTVDTRSMIFQLKIEFLKWKDYFRRPRLRLRIGYNTEACFWSELE